MERRSQKKSPERIRVEIATERWRDAQTGSVRLWPELTDQDKERLAMRRLRHVAGTLGWDEVLHRLGIRRGKPERAMQD